MQAEQSLPILKCKNIVCSPRGLAEADGNKVVVFVQAAEVDYIILKHGRPEHRPVVSLSIGAIFTVIGFYGLAELILAPRAWRYELGMMFFGFVGGSIIFDVLKQRHFLEVQKIKGNSRLVFSKATPLAEIRDFCEKVRAIYKYKITEEI
jgi:hypothetical protein